METVKGYVGKDSTTKRDEIITCTIPDDERNWLFIDTPKIAKANGFDVFKCFDLWLTLLSSIEFSLQKKTRNSFLFQKGLHMVFLFLQM